MKNNINILNALNESLEEEFKAKRKLKEAENNSKYEVKTYHIEDMGGHTMALFGQFKNGNYFAGNEGGINIYDEDVWPYYEDYEKSENMDWEEYNKNHLIDDINPDINTKVFNSIMRYTNFMDVEENLDEASFKDKVSAIKKSLKKNDKRLSNKSAQKSAEKIAGSMVKNEAQEFVITYIPDNNQKDKTASISVQGNNKQQATQQARQTIGNAAIVSIQPLTEANKMKGKKSKLNEIEKDIITKEFKIGSNNVEIELEDGNHIRKIWWTNNKGSTGFNYDEDNDKFIAFEGGNFLSQKQEEILKNKIHKLLKEDETIIIPNTKVTDYISMDELDDLIKNNSILGNITNSFRVLDDMTIEITTDMGKSYYKIIKNDDGKLEAYWINKDGEALGDTFILKEDETIIIPNTKVETDYIINDVTTLNNINDGDVQAPDIEALLTLIDESLKFKYSDNWGKIKTLSSSKNESYSYALVDISTPEVLKEFENKGITDVAIGKNLILESFNNMYKFKVNSLNGTTKYSKVTNNPKKTIYEWIESEFLHEAKIEKEKEEKLLKEKTEKETVENYINNRIDLKMEIENIKMFINLSKQIKAEDDMKKSIQDRMYAFAAEMPNNIEISNNNDKYELKFNTFDDIVEIVFGKEWVAEPKEDNKVVGIIKESKDYDDFKDLYNYYNNDRYGDDDPNFEAPEKEVKEKFKELISNGYIVTNGRQINLEDIKDLKESTLNEAYEQFNIGNIEVVFNPDTYECLYSIPSADVKDKKINLTKIPTVETPYDTNTIIKDYIETKFGRIPSEEQNKNQQQIDKKQPTEKPSMEEPVNQQTTGEEMSTSEEPVEEAELPDEPGDDVDTGIDLDNSDENVDQETEEAQAETGSSVFYKIRPNQNSSIEDIREKSLDADTPQSNYIVVDTIDLPSEKWEDFISDFSKPQDFLIGIKAIDRKNYSFNVVKITNNSANFTLLVDPLGYDYARYISIIDNI